MFSRIQEDLGFTQEVNILSRRFGGKHCVPIIYRAHDILKI